MTPTRPPQTIADWQAAWRGGADPGELLRAARDNVARRGRPVYLHVADDAALDAQLARLRAWPAAERAARPLWGVPFVVKDNIDIAGAPTTAACPAWSRVAERHATVVQRLLDAGAVGLAKANLDQFATGLVGTRSPYGAPVSAWSADHISGGSSSGSAVAVAHADVPFALGTDTAGSGRVPAAFNHVVGLKPTPGRCPTTGVLPACRTLDCPSVFALTVDDAVAVLAVIEGADAADPFSGAVAGPAAWPGPLRIGVPAVLDAGVGADEAAALASTATALREAGHRTVAVDFAPLHEVAQMLYGGPWVAERHLVVRELLARDPGALDPTVHAVIGAAAGYDADDAFAARYRLQALSRVADTVWRDVDVLLVPTAPRHPTCREVAADPIGANAALGVYTNFVNLLGWCALALPAAVSARGLPLGVTLVGRGGHDVALAALGREWAAIAQQPLGATGRAAASASAPAADAPASEPVLPLAVVGAHLSGLPLNRQLTELGATLLDTTRTAPRYRLYALSDTTPPKPGLVRMADGGVSIEAEVWAVPQAGVGRLLAAIPAPLGLGRVELEDGAQVTGFLCESAAIAGAADISRHGGWRAYLAHLSTT